MTGRDSGALSMNKAIEKTLHVLKKVYIYIYKAITEEDVYTKGSISMWLAL